VRRSRLPAAEKPFGLKEADRTVCQRKALTTLKNGRTLGTAGSRCPFSVFNTLLKRLCRVSSDPARYSSSLEAYADARGMCLARIGPVATSAVAVSGT
jgi:hypothetical protein